MDIREQPIVDMGIDAHIELVEEGNPLGKLIALQIKTGESYFYEKEKSFTFYLDETHYNYWVNHSLPVILIGHIPERNITLWQYVDRNNVEKTTKGWKIEIPKENDLTDISRSKYQITEILNSKSLNGKITKLRLDRNLIKYISEGGKVNIYTQEWHNKSLGRGPFKIILIDKNGNEEIVREWNRFYTSKLEDLIEKNFPWADIEVDKDYYDKNFHNSYYGVYTDYYKLTNKIFPFNVLSGEVSEYRINLKLNKIGLAFIDLEDYLEK
ncbi:MAG: DUF4365 domain-containing protein [Saprospiraceae bacterium]|nr:DUF4365 domain-containing protein [Saprospiraceae bacterium]